MDIFLKNIGCGPGRAPARQKGFTLIETLIAVAIISIGAMISLMFFVRANVSTQLARDVTVASVHADYVLEEMYGRKTLADITDTDWTQWAQQSGLDTLPAEIIAVTYQDKAVDPLPVEVQVSWQREKRPGNISITAEFTK